MEHRWSKRQAVALRVRIHQAGLPAVAAVARNIGLEGLFVEYPPGANQGGKLLNLEISLGDGQRRRCYFVPGLIRHVSEQGVGVMFNTFNPRLFQALDDMLHPSGRHGA